MPKDSLIHSRRGILQIQIGREPLDRGGKIVTDHLSTVLICRKILRWVQDCTPF